MQKRQSVIFGWLRDNRPLPAEHVLAVEEATGISRHDLRPDIYPRDEAPLLREGDSLEGVRP
ncbi:DNA-binding transcriptional regulator YdaS (Cro superfamily) [Sphingobium olei]